MRVKASICDICNKLNKCSTLHEPVMDFTRGVTVMQMGRHKKSMLAQWFMPVQSAFAVKMTAAFFSNLNPAW